MAWNASAAAAAAAASGLQLTEQDRWVGSRQSPKDSLVAVVELMAACPVGVLAAMAMMLLLLFVGQLPSSSLLCTACFVGGKDFQPELAPAAELGPVGAESLSGRCFAVVWLPGEGVGCAVAGQPAAAASQAVGTV